MKVQRIALLLLFLLLTGLAACSPGHLGSNEIAYIRDGHLWTSDPDGANAFEAVAQDAPVIGYTWSPTHQVLAFRTLDGDFAKKNAVQRLVHNPISGLITDAPATVNTIGIDGGSAIPVAFSNAQISYSNPMWNANGTRLLYRQAGYGNTGIPSENTWWVSQNDQPGGIAIRSLPGSYSIPSLSYTSAGYKAIGNSQAGLFTTSLSGTNKQTLQYIPLPGHPLTAAMERVLWQPGHQDRNVVYAESLYGALSAQNLVPVRLVLDTIGGQKSILAECQCTQFAWSPDGNKLLYSNGVQYNVLDLQSHTTFTINAEPGCVIYWSPNSHFLVLDGLHRLILADIAQKRYQVLLSDNATAADLSKEMENIAGTTALLEPAANSVWSADSQQFLLQTHGRLQWQGKHLTTGKGLYTVTIDSTGRPQGSPVLVDNGNDTQPGWTYQDANTSFLY